MEAPKGEGLFFGGLTAAASPKGEGHSNRFDGQVRIIQKVNSSGQRYS
jgi:hypothetical protein